MISLYTTENSRAMEPALQRDQANTSLDLNPRFGPQKPTSVLRVFKIMVGVMFFQLPSGVVRRTSGVEGGAVWDLRWITFLRRDALGHKRGSPDTLCPIFPVRAIFLGCGYQHDEVGGLEVTLSRLCPQRRCGRN